MLSNIIHINIGSLNEKLDRTKWLLINDNELKKEFREYPEKYMQLQQLRTEVGHQKNQLKSTFQKKEADLVKKFKEQSDREGLNWKVMDVDARVKSDAEWNTLQLKIREAERQESLMMGFVMAFQSRMESLTSIRSMNKSIDSALQQ